MIKCTILKNGNLKITAGNEARQWIKENRIFCTEKKTNKKVYPLRGYWDCMADLFEGYSCNGSFSHFDAGKANPFVGLTDAPCIAESMYPDDDCKNVIDGRLWAFKDYVMRDDLEELKNKGFVIYQLVEEDKE